MQCPAGSVLTGRPFYAASVVHIVIDVAVLQNVLIFMGVQGGEPTSAEDCFADESDTSTDEESDNFSEDEVDKWPCVKCGIKNKPFFRYCLKCWQVSTGTSAHRGMNSVCHSR